MASLADMRVVRTIETRATTSGVRETTAALNEMAGAHGKVSTAAASSAQVTESSARGQGSLAGAFERVRRQLDPLHAATEKYNRQMAILDRAASAGQGLDQYGALAAAARGRLDALRGANDNVTKSIGLQRHEWTNLGRQMQDVGTMAAMGASGMQILTSQAAQVYDVLASSQGGVKGALKEVGSSIAGLITPGRAAFAAIAAGAGLAAYAIARASSQANEFNKALRLGAGTRSDVSAADVKEFSNVPGLSRSEGRAGALAYASTGASRDNVKAAQNLTPGLANAVYGGDVDEAQKNLAGAMKGGTAALMKYVNDIRPLSPATADWIEKLEASKGAQVANAELLKILNEGLRNAGIEIPLWSKALTRLGNVASDLADDLLKEVVKTANTTVKEFQAIKGVYDAVVGSFGSSSRNVRGPLALGAAGIGAAGAEGTSNIGAIVGRGIAGAKDAVGLTKTYDAEDEALRKLNLDLTTYNRLMEDSTVKSQMTAEQIEAATKAQKQLEGAVGSYLSAEDKRRKSDELTLRSINARTDAERTLIAVEQKRIELSGAQISPADRQRALAAVGEQEAARNAKGIEDRNRRVTEMNDALKVQRDSFGLADEAAEAMRIRLQMTTEATQNSQTVVERYGAQWETVAAQMAKAKVATDDLTKAQQNVIQGMDEMRSGSRGLMTGVFSDLRQGKDPRQAILSGLGRMADQSFDRMISKPLTESLLGADGKAGGGLFGNFLSSGMQTASMNVTAANVTIGGLGSLTGGVPGLGGLTGGAGASAAAGGAGTGGGGGILGALVAPFAAARSLVTGGNGKVLSYNTGGAGGLPITVNPSGTAPGISLSGGGGIGDIVGGSGSGAITPSWNVVSSILDARLRPRAASLVPGAENLPSHVDTSIRTSAVTLQPLDNAVDATVPKIAELGATAAQTGGAFENVVKSISSSMAGGGGSGPGFGLGGLFSVGKANASGGSGLQDATGEGWGGAFAAGTDFAPGGLSLVGERGPELMQVPRGASITPNHLLDARLAGPRAAPTSYTNAPNVTVNVPPMANGVTPEQVAEHVSAALQRNNRQLGRNLGRIGGDSAARYG